MYTRIIFPSKRKNRIRNAIRRKILPINYDPADTVHLILKPSCLKRRAGGLEEWKNKVGYHRRSLVENAFYRWKIIFGDHLKSRKDETQYIEQCLRAKIINKFNELGLPKYEIAN